MDTVTTAVADIDFGVAPGVAEMVPVAPQAPVVVPEGMIERAARDPNVDIDKLERLIAMQERMDANRARVEFDNAMAAAQAEMDPIRADLENKQTKSRYASYAQLDSAIRPIYSVHGFALSFNTGDAPNPIDVRVLCTASHRGGHRQEYKIDIPADGKGPQGAAVMTRTHATGAAASYGQRYLFKLIFNLAVGDVDDDGNGANGDDDDMRRLAGPNAAVDPATGRLRSNYDVAKIQKAKEFADFAIQSLNTAPNPEAAKEWRHTYSTVAPGKRKSALQKLEDDSPGQFLRVKTCFENVTGEQF